MKSSLHNRIVVTGIGLITPVGSDPESLQQSIASPAATPTHNGHCEFSGHINDFGPLQPPTKKLIRKSLKLMNRETQLGVAAAQKAITSSGSLDADYQADRIGVVFGAGNVEIQQDDFASGVAACRQQGGNFDPAIWGQFGVSHVDPLWLLRVLPNMPACHFAIANDLRGPNNTITQGSVATNMAICEARNTILDDDADVMIVGGTGTNLDLAGTTESTRPAEAAAALVLERMGAAIERRAMIYGEILAASSSTTIHRDHRADPESAAIGAITATLKTCRFEEQSLEYNNTDEIEKVVGQAEAGSSAVGLAATLLAHAAGSDIPATVYVSSSRHGLASCVLIGSVAHRVAA